MSSSLSFSQSSKFQSTTSKSFATNSVSFDCRAICSEYEAAFSPYAKQELDPEFKKALEDLPVPYDKDNSRHVAAYAKFLETYGTNYVRHVVLGGKRIYSTSMSSSDYSSLSSQSVDISSSMSFEMQAAMGSSAKAKAGLVKGAAKLASTMGGKAAAIGSIVDVVTEDTDNDTVLFGADASVASSYSLGMFASSKQQAEDSIKISQKKLEKSEVNVGE